MLPEDMAPIPGYGADWLPAGWKACWKITHDNVRRRCFVSPDEQIFWAKGEVEAFVKAEQEFDPADRQAGAELPPAAAAAAEGGMEEDPDMDPEFGCKMVAGLEEMLGPSAAAADGGTAGGAAAATAAAESTADAAAASGESGAAPPTRGTDDAADADVSPAKASSTEAPPTPTAVAATSEAQEVAPSAAAEAPSSAEEAPAGSGEPAASEQVEEAL